MEKDAQHLLIKSRKDGISLEELFEYKLQNDLGKSIQVYKIN